MGTLEGLVLGSNASRWSRPEHSEKGDRAIYCPNWDTFEREKQHHPVTLPPQVCTDSPRQAGVYAHSEFCSLLDADDTV